MKREKLVVNTHYLFFPKKKLKDSFIAPPENTFYGLGIGREGDRFESTLKNVPLDFTPSARQHNPSSDRKRCPKSRNYRASFI
jgi:hypothetical protein